MKTRIFLITALIISAAIFTSCASGAANPSEVSDSPAIVTESEPIESDSSADDTGTAEDYDIKELIDRNLDIIISDTKAYLSEKEFIEAHPDEFDNIVALGEDALPYLDEIGDGIDTISGDGSLKEKYRCIVAMAAAYRIKPELYDFVSPSPDGSYSIKASDCIFFSLLDGASEARYGKVSVIDNVTDAVIADFNNYGNVDAVWSADSRYAAISLLVNDAGTLKIFDTAGRKFLSLPLDEIVNFFENDQPFPTEIHYYYFEYESLFFLGWEADDQLKVGIRLDAGESYDPDSITGWYIYDLTERKITDYSYTLTLSSGDKAELVYTPEPETGSDGIQAVIDRKLDYILSAGSRWDDEQDYIDANPDEFAAIVALGEDALPYLIRIGEKVDEYPSNYVEQHRCIIAMAAAYAIKPELYDIAIASPDGSYVLRAEVESFSDNVSSAPQLSYKGISVIDSRTGAPITESDEQIRDLRAEWSADSRYAAAEAVKRSGRTDVTIFDTLEKCALTVPLDEIVTQLNDELKLTLSANAIDVYFGQWMTDNLLTLKFRIPSYYLGEGEIAGQFAYNLSDRTIADFSYTNELTTPTFPEPYDDTSEIIRDKLDIIADSYSDCGSEQEFIDAHPDEFAAIVALGEDALPYLTEIIESPGIDYGNPRRQAFRCMAMAAAYQIKPGLFEPVYTSPDGKYTLRFNIGTFFTLSMLGTFEYKNALLIDNASGEVIASTDETYYYMEVEWFSDSRYAAVTRGDLRYFKSTEIFDADNKRVIDLPDNEICDMVEDQLGRPISLYSLNVRPDEWVEPGQIKMSVNIVEGSASNGKLITAWYTYDLSEDRIIDWGYEITE